jgi:membrane protease YdiL (CAAX protease family)
VQPTTDGPPDPAAAEAEPRWGFGDVAITLGAALALGLVAAVVVALLGDSPTAGTGGGSATGRAWASLLLLVIPWIALAGWPLRSALRRGRGPVRDFGLTLSWSQAAVGFAGGVVALLVASELAAVQEQLTGTKLSSAVGTLAQQTTSASPVALAILALCTAFGAPVVEEIAFRGLTFGAFRKMGQPALQAGVWTTLLFALFHFEPARIGILLVIGGCLAFVRARTGSTLASMVTHMTVNVPGAIYILSLHHGG